MSKTITVKMARPSEDEVESLWKLFHAAEAAEDRWNRESSEQFLERLDDREISDEERTFIAVAWDSLVQGHGGFGRFMGAYNTLIYNFQDPDADHVATHPKFNALLTESELLPVVLDGYADARNTIAELKSERDAALNTCTLIAEALGITGAVAGDTIARVQQLVGENAVLTDKAASELSNAWLLHRTVMGTQAALFCITQGNLGQAREWLEGTTDEAQLEIPDGMEVNGLQGWFDENMAGHITHAKAVEIIKSETPATTQAINEIKAQGSIEFAEFLKVQAKESLSRGDHYVFDRLNAQAVTAERFAASLRGGE
ncbi:hypothetical protein D5F51_03290 [Yersinia hibernica]|uniref:Uncharacterized protein n=1 Tax=Yersinia hibernica TaxID=2339259 RepID=A0ABX5QX60_9GAMM|nr:hypothetical protein [Yersinia hibernica]QAX77658.1 hypothetical protein D5F51_03290 [Yersinia hibernica]